MKNPRATSHDSFNSGKISDILSALPDQFTKAKVTIGDLTKALSGRAYGILLLVLSLPNLIPVPAPGLSALLGVPLVFITFQLMLGLNAPRLPSILARRSIKNDHLRAVCHRVIPWMQRLELIIRPRLLFFTAAPMDCLISLICFILSLMIVMPIPFGNAFPALAICLFAIGILQKDGLFIVAGLAVTCISATVIVAFMSGLLHTLEALVGL